MKTFSILLALALAPLAWGGEILQPQSSGDLNIYAYSPIGQTFTAEDPNVSIGFFVGGITASSTTQLTYTLLTGAGTGGTLLGTESLTLPGNFVGYADMNFSSVSLTVGQTYSVLLTENNPNLLVVWNQLYDGLGTPIPGKIDYTGGEMIDEGQLDPIGDLTFRIYPVPEPGTLALFLMGCFCLFARSRLVKQSRCIANPTEAGRHLLKE